MSGVVLGGVVEVVGSNLARGKIFTASIGSVDSLYQYIYIETRFRECGQVDSVQHFLLECPLYEEARYILLYRLREQLGIQSPSVYTLLGYEVVLSRPTGEIWARNYNASLKLSKT